MTEAEKKLLETMGKAHAQMKDVARKLESGADLTPEEDTQFKQWNAEYEAARNKVEMLRKSQELENAEKIRTIEPQAGNGGKVDTSKLRSFERMSIYKKGMFRGEDTLNQKEKAVFQEMEKENAVFTKIMFGAELDNEEQLIARNFRAQSTTAAAGGYTIPQGFIPRIDAKLKYISPFFAEMQMGLSPDAASIFDVIRTATGNDLPMPTNDDTGVTGELLAENTDAFANDEDLTFGQIILKAYKYNSKPFKVSNELLNDTDVDLVGYIADALATRIARIANSHLTTGDNSSKPQGIVTGATAGKTAAATTAITFPEVLDLIHSVDPAYRNSASARLMFHDNILLYLKKLSVGASDARPLWQPGYAVGAPDTIDGYRYLINQDMASSVAATNVTMLFGDMKKYMVRLVSNYVVKRLDERFADLDQTAWLMFARLDGRYANTSAIKKLTQAAS